MDRKEFKKALETILSQYGFEYYSKEKTYYHFSDRLTTAIDIQKDEYTDSYYINFGFRIVDTEDTIKFPRTYNGVDVSGRFAFDDKNGKELVNIRIEALDKETFFELSRKFIERTIIPVINRGMQELFLLEPSYVYCLTRRGKMLLGIPE